MRPDDAGSHISSVLSGLSCRLGFPSNAIEKHSASHAAGPTFTTGDYAQDRFEKKTRSRFV